MKANLLILFKLKSKPITDYFTNVEKQYYYLTILIFSIN